MSALPFLNPSLLWLLGLASIPLIIHLLFRRRFKRIEWAPMRYLKLTIQRNRRRIQIEQWLLLLLRTALLIVLVFLVSRPLLNSAGIGRWLGGDSRTSQILVIDDSLSMGMIEGGRSSFDHAVELAQKVIREIGPKDRFTLVLASDPEHPLLREVEISDPEAAGQLLRKAKPAGEFVSWGPVLRAVGSLLDSSVYPIRDATIVTDLRRAGWDEELRDLDKWTSDRVRVRIFDVGRRVSRQLALTGLERVDRLSLVGNPTRWEAVIRNGGELPVDQSEGTLLVDGKPSPFTVPAIGPGETARLPIDVTFQETGLHSVSLQLPADDLPGDDQRWDVVDVRDSLRLLLVDGEPSTEPLRGEVDFLALALSLAIGDAAAFQVETITDSEWLATPQQQPDLLVLANVANISPPQAERLQRQVEAGMGLIVFPGDQIDPDSYNQNLYRDGKGLLPGAFESTIDEPVTGLVLEEATPSPLDALRQLNAAVRERIKSNRRSQVKLAGDADPAVRVLARWNDANSSPAVIEKVVGRGRVLQWTTTADKGWSDWPTEPSYVLAMRESAKATAQADAGVRDVTAGNPLRRGVSVDQEITSPTIEPPGGDEPKPLSVESDTASPEDKTATGQKFLTWSDTRLPGLYRLNWVANPGGPGSDLYGVNPDRRESELAPISHDELRSRWGAVQPEIISAVASGNETVDVRGREIWRQLALWLLGMMACEACFATYVGRQR